MLLKKKTIQINGHKLNNIMNLIIKQLLIWSRHHNRMFWRSKVAVFFTVFMPLGMMFLFNFLNVGEIRTSEGFIISYSDFFVPALACFSAASATYTNLAITQTIYREERILKRIKGTPLMPQIYILSTIVSAVWIAFLGTVLLMVIGVIAFDASFIIGRVGWVIVFFALGVVVFSLLGLALSSFVKTSRSAPVATNATILPLAFVSGIFIYADQYPKWIQVIGSIFPLKAFSEGLKLGFDPSFSGDEISNLGILLIWGALGLLYMNKYFRWVPSAERSSGMTKNE